MNDLFDLSLVFSVWLFCTSALLASGTVDVCPSISPAVVGDNVTLSLCPPVAVTSGAWDVSGSLIVAWLENQQAVFPSHAGRASVDVFTGALTLSSITAADSGLYEVQSDEPPLRANTELVVLGKDFTVPTLNLLKERGINFFVFKELELSF